MTMSEAGARILIVDDELSVLDSLRILFRSEGWKVETASGGRAAIDELPTLRPDLVLTDIRMPGASGIEVLDAVRSFDPEIPVILMTAQASLQTAVQAVNAGAYHYIQKPFSNEDLLATCRRAVERRDLRLENRALRKELREAGQGRRLRGMRPVGSGERLQSLLGEAETIAPTDSTVLITGESGTGKEVLARYIHSRSLRASGPFLSINCGALPESLLESELFGHLKGAFTGAVRDRDGLLVAAGGGTFFLDEVGEMTPSTQVKLLRALQEREVIPVGATQAVPVDVRIISATNRDLEEQIREGKFRTDLYYRLNVIHLHVPPLRERMDDLPLLITHFLKEWERAGRPSPEISSDAIEALARYDWPGNVRELENALERAAVLSPERIVPSSLPERVRSAPPVALVAERTPTNPTLEVIEQAYIRWVVETEGGNKSRAAEVLGIDPSTLYRKLARYAEGTEGT